MHTCQMLASTMIGYQTVDDCNSGHMVKREHLMALLCVHVCHMAEHNGNILLRLSCARLQGPSHLATNLDHVKRHAVRLS